jgi:hypothetical protein
LLESDGHALQIVVVGLAGAVVTVGREPVVRAPADLADAVEDGGL